MSLKTIRLELARCAEFPVGSKYRGYEFVAPLDAEAHIDLAEWRTNRTRCVARRFWEGEDDLYGHLVHAEGDRWAFHYDLETEPGVDEPGYRFGAHAFRPGEYVSIAERDGATRTFTVTSVD
jgi:hypothetical protein